MSKIVDRQCDVFRFYDAEKKVGSIIEVCSLDEDCYRHFSPALEGDKWSYIATFSSNELFFENGVINSLVTDLVHWADKNDINLIFPRNGLFNEKQNECQVAILSEFDFIPHGDKFIIRNCSKEWLT